MSSNLNDKKLHANQTEGAFFQVIVATDGDTNLEDDDAEIPGTYDFKLKADHPELTAEQIADVVLAAFRREVAIGDLDSFDILVVDRQGDEIEAKAVEGVASSELTHLVCYLGKGESFDEDEPPESVTQKN